MGKKRCNAMSRTMGSRSLGFGVLLLCGMVLPAAGQFDQERLTQLSNPVGEAQTQPITPEGIVLPFASPAGLTSDESILLYATFESEAVRLFSHDLIGDKPSRLLVEVPSLEVSLGTTVDPTDQRCVYRLNFPAQVAPDDLYSVPIQGGEPPVQLNDPADGSVESFQITADGQFVVYTARIGGGDRRLFSVPIAGGAIQQLSGDGFVGVFRLTADGSLVIFEEPGILSTPVRDGGVTQLTGEDERFWLPSPDSSTVVYHDNPTGGLFAVPVGGGPSVELVPGEGGFLRFTDDGQRIVYQYAPGVFFDLYSLPSSGGSAVQLNDRSQHVGVMASWILSNDSQWAVMRMDHSNQPYMLASAPLTGGPMVVLEEVAKVPPVFTGVRDFDITSDSEWVLILVDRDDGFGRRLQRIPIAGGESVKLNPTGNVQEFQLSEDGRRVFYRVIPPGSPDSIELRMLPVDGDAPPALVHLPLVPGRQVNRLMASADGSTVIYSVDQDVEGVFDLFVSRFNGQLFGDGFESGATNGWSRTVQ